MSRPKIVIIAGPNGAGKTTFARAFLPQEAQLSRFINADLIAAGLSPFAPEAEAIKAGRLMLRLRVWRSVFARVVITFLKT
ncbi:hypothetical protein GmRootV15_07790 [Variovorax sp. V15]